MQTGLERRFLTRNSTVHNARGTALYVQVTDAGNGRHFYLFAQFFVDRFFYFMLVLLPLDHGAMRCENSHHAYRIARQSSSQSESQYTAVDHGSEPVAEKGVAGCPDGPER